MFSEDGMWPWKTWRFLLSRTGISHDCSIETGYVSGCTDELSWQRGIFMFERYIIYKRTTFHFRLEAKAGRWCWSVVVFNHKPHLQRMTRKDVSVSTQAHRLIHSGSCVLGTQEDGEGGVDIFGSKLSGRDGKQNWPWKAHRFHKITIFQPEPARIVQTTEGGMVSSYHSGSVDWRNIFSETLFGSLLRILGMCLFLCRTSFLSRFRDLQLSLVFPLLFHSFQHMSYPFSFPFRSAVVNFSSLPGFIFTHIYSHYVENYDIHPYPTLMIDTWVCLKIG